MAFDIQITEINKIYCQQSHVWARDFFAPREHNGLVYFTAGAIEYSFGDFKVTARPNCMMKFPKNLAYSGKLLTPEEGVEFIVIDFETSAPDELDALETPMLLDCSEFDFIKEHFFEILKIGREVLPHWQLQAKSLLYRLLTDFISVHHRFSDNKTAAVLEYINHNLSNQELGYDLLCAHFYISESQLRRNFSKYTGQNPHEYITNRRIELSKQLLLFHRDRPVKDISAECGFASPYYFSKCFSAKTGMSPKKFRDTHAVTFE